MDAEPDCEFATLLFPGKIPLTSGFIKGVFTSTYTDILFTMRNQALTFESSMCTKRRIVPKICIVLFFVLYYPCLLPKGMDATAT